MKNNRTQAQVHNEPHRNVVQNDNGRYELPQNIKPNLAQNAKNIRSLSPQPHQNGGN